MNTIEKPTTMSFLRAHTKLLNINTLCIRRMNTNGKSCFKVSIASIIEDHTEYVLTFNCISDAVGAVHELRDIFGGSNNGSKN